MVDVETAGVKHCMMLTFPSQPNNTSNVTTSRPRHIYVHADNSFVSNRLLDFINTVSPKTIIENRKPVRAHCFNVYTTSITLERRRMNVKSTLCAYWKLISRVLQLSSIWIISSLVFWVTYKICNKGKYFVLVIVRLSREITYKIY